MQALDQYLVDARQEASRIIQEQYMVGRNTVLDSVFGVQGMMTDPDKVFANALVHGNIDLLTGVGRNYMVDVENLTRAALTEGLSPHDIRQAFNSIGMKFESSSKVVAFDQVAKAQELGRSNEYAKLGVQKVEIMVAPDACDTCQPHSHDIQPLQGGDRPQYHIQCLCFDIPTSDDAERAQGQFDGDPLLSSMSEEGAAARREAMDSTYHDYLMQEWNTRASGEAIQYYTGSGYNHINDFLRFGEVYEDPAKTARMMSSLDDLISRAPRCPNDMTLFRGMSGKGLTLDQLERTVGTTIQDLGYMSTTTDHAIASSFARAGGYVMELQAPQGTLGMYLGEREGEFILGRGVNLIVKGIYKSGEVTHVVMGVVNAI